MGIRKHFVISTGSQIFVGPAAYYYLEKKYTAAIKRGYLLAALSTTGSWRNRIIPLYNALASEFGKDRVGALRELKLRNPKKDAGYRVYLEWVASHQAPKPLP